jgi:Tfp pilus assembly major pilin PilA
MVNRNNQLGMSFISWLLVIGIAGALAVVGLKLIPVYMEYGTVVSVLEDIAEQQAASRHTPAAVWKSIEKRLEINNISYIKKEDFKSEKTNGGEKFTIKYEVRTHMFGNLDTVASFDKTVEVRY